MKTLYIGAHQDDILIGAGIEISRNPKDVHTLTISDGVSGISYPWTPKNTNLTYSTSQAYFAQRDTEENTAIKLLGVDVDNCRFFGKIPDQKAYTRIDDVVRLIDETVCNNGIGKIITHHIPEAHPDHEIANFASYVVGKRRGVEIEEFMGYRINPKTDDFTRTFDPRSSMQNIRKIDFTPKEVALKEEASKKYLTQKSVIDLFRSDHELFGKRKSFDIDNLPESIYYYRNREGMPTCDDIRNAMKEYLAKNG